MSAPEEIFDHVAFADAVVRAGMRREEGRHDVFRIDAEDHPVDGFELQGIVMVVDEFHERVAGRRGVSRLAFAGLQVLKALLRGGKRVVAVAHCVEKRRGVFQAVFRFLNFGAP